MFSTLFAEIVNNAIAFSINTQSIYTRMFTATYICQHFCEEKPYALYFQAVKLITKT